MMRKKELINYLSDFITDKRNSTMEKVLNGRTRHITIMLENIYQPHNVSAVLRTCECLGVQDVHIVENSNSYRVNHDVVLGADKWLTLHRYRLGNDNTPQAISSLKKQGYMVVATTPGKKSITPDELDITKQKTAFLFGTEISGLSKYATDNADVQMNIPMSGFTGSFNISVSAAIILSHSIRSLKNSDTKWSLPEKEREEIKLQWLLNSIKKSDVLLKNLKNGKI